MKISVITLHNIANYGSVLQAYATQFIVEKLGHEVKIIDYSTRRMTKKGMIENVIYNHNLLRKSLLLRTIARIILTPSYLKRFPVFKKFVAKNLKLSDHLYTCEGDFYKYPINTDLYLTGSDQVWNTEPSKGIDKPFFISFDDTKKKISYSASFGKSCLEENEKNEIKNLLSKYEYISVREKSGVDILYDLGLKGEWVLDPTLLLTKNEWEPFISKKYRNRKYILVYNINHEKGLDKFVKRLEQEKRLPVYILSYHWHNLYKLAMIPHGKLKLLPSVEEFLGIIHDAEYVITDSFHGLVFSVLFNKQVMPYYPHNFSTRLASLVEMVGLEKQVVDENSSIDIANQHIDWNKVNNKLQLEREKSLLWLQKAIGDRNV